MIVIVIVIVIVTVIVIVRYRFSSGVYGAGLRVVGISGLRGFRV